MDHKSWLWKKRSTEKTLEETDKANSSLSKDEQEEVNEVQKLLNEKTNLERDLEMLNEKLSSAVAECNAKDSITMKQVKIAEEAIAGWEKAENEAVSLKRELERVLQQKAASEERIDNLDAALKECMQQLRFVREEQEKRVHGAVVKTSEEFQNIRISLDEKLAEASKRLAKLDAENTQLSKALSGKDKVIEDLSKYKSKVESDLTALKLRVESTEKENASLRYEVRVLEKELDSRSEEREFNRRTADVAEKQLQESVKRIAKLETECQRLRVLVRKQLPGPAALAKMKSEVGMLAKDQVETRRRKANASPTRSLEFCRSEGTCSSLLPENSLAASADLGSDDKASCSESWASALISELEHFKNAKQTGTLSHKNMGTPEMNLMDDFAEMEKLAVVSVDYPAGSSHHSSEELTEDMKVALAQSSSAYASNDGSGKVAQSLNLDESDIRNVNDISNPKENGRKLQSNVSISIQKVLELLEGINVQSQDNGIGESFSGTTVGYTVRVFQWKTAEISSILLQFVQTCNDLLDGTVGLDQFAQQVASNLEWVINHCFSLQDVSSMKDAIRNHFDWDESRSENELDTSHFPMVCNNSSYQMEAHQPPNKGDSTNKESSAVDMEESLQAEIVKTEYCRNQLKESKDIIENLHSEMEILKQSKGNMGNQVEKQKMMKEDLETQLIETNHEKEKAQQRILHLENELQNNCSYCERLEEECHGLKTKLNSFWCKEKVKDAGKHSDKQLQNDWEITAASEKLAECQETILNLGKQLKALASPSDAALFDKVISTPADPVATNHSIQKNISRRSSLLNKMLAEDNDTRLQASPETKKDIENENSNSAVTVSTPNGISHDDISKNAVTSMDIVPSKKGGRRSFFKRLFWRRKKRN